MSDELRIAVNCHNSGQRPALRRKCSKCVVSGGVDHLAGSGRSTAAYIDNTYVPGIEPINELYHHHPEVGVGGGGGGGQHRCRPAPRGHCDPPVYVDSHRPHHHHNQAMGKFGPNIISNLIRRTPSIGNRVKHSAWSTANSSSRVIQHYPVCPAGSYGYEENDDTGDDIENSEEMIGNTVNARPSRLSNHRDEEEDDVRGDEGLMRQPAPVNRTPTGGLGYNRSLVDVECYRDTHHSRQYLDRITPSPPPPPSQPNGEPKQAKPIIDADHTDWDS